MERERNHASLADFFARFLDALSIDSDVTLGDDGLGEGAALRQPDEEEEAVDPHFFRSLASSAKAWLPPGRAFGRGGCRPRQRHASPARVKPTSAISRAIASSSRPTDVASSASTGSVPPAERTLRAWLARRSARSIRTQVRPARR